MKEEKEHSIVLVPAEWLAELLKLAMKAEREEKNSIPDLIGYAKSANTYLKYSERIEP